MNSTASDCRTGVTNHTVCEHRSEIESKGFKPIVDDHTLFIYQIILNVFTNGVISVFGIVANVLNIIVFLRQGIFTEYGTAGIFGLAVADLFCVLSTLWLCIIEAVILAKPSNLSWDPAAVKTATAFWVHMMFAYITRMVTVYVAFERCVCVMLPFKVKTLLKPRRALIIICGIFVVVGACFIPHYIAFQLRFVTDPNTNITRLILVTNFKFRSLALDEMRYVSGYAMNMFTVIAVFACTLITAIRINSSKTWRESVSASSKSDQTKSDNSQDAMAKSKTGKEARLVRMIIIISIVFLICYIPLLAYLILISANSDFGGFRGKYKNFSSVMYTLAFLTETINSSINIIVYYTMSTRYREELRAFLGLEKNAKGT